MIRIAARRLAPRVAWVALASWLLSLLAPVVARAEDATEKPKPVSATAKLG